MALTDYFNSAAKKQLKKSENIVKVLNTPAKKQVAAQSAGKKVAPAKVATKAVVPRTTTTQKQSNLIASLKPAAQAQAKKSTKLMEALSGAAKKSVVTSKTPVAKKTGLIESLRKKVKDGLTMPTRVSGESSMTYAQKLMGKQEKTAQAKTGLKETLLPKVVKQNVSKSIEGKQLFGQRQSITGRTVPDEDIATNASKLAKFFLPRSQKEITAQEVVKGGAPGEISDRIARAGMEEGISNVIGMGGIKAVGGAAKQSISKLKPLYQEAKKYKSAEEFVKAQTKQEYRSAHQLSLADSITADKIDIPTLKEQIRTRNGYLNNYNLADLKKLEKLRNNPEADITIYRASPKNEINEGDWVTTDKTYANDIKKQNGGKVYSYTVKVKDLRFPKDSETLPSLSMASTFSYSSKASQLTDIWKEANNKKLSNFGLGIEEDTRFAKISQKTTAQNTLRDTENGKTSIVSSKLAPISDKLSSTGKDIKTEFFDRYAPIQDLIKPVKKTISAEKDPYIAVRNYAGHMGIVENKLNDLSAVIKPSKDIIKDVKQYALLDRYEELIGRGINKLPDGLDSAKVAAQKAEIEKKMGIEGMKRVNDTIKGIRQYNDNLLKEVKDSGILSQAGYDAIKKNNEKYIPLQRIEYLAEQADNIPRGSNAFSVASQSVIKGIKGSEKAVADPLESMVRNTYNTVKLVERNKVATKVADLSKLPEFEGVVIPLREAEKVQKRIDIFTELGKTKIEKNKLERLIVTRNRWSRRLNSEVNKLNKLGVNEYLKRPSSDVMDSLRSSVKIIIKPEEIKELAPNSFDALKNSYGAKDILKKEYATFDRLKQEVKTGGWSRLIEIGIDKNTAESVAKQIFKSPVYKSRQVIAEDAGFAIQNTSDVKRFINDLIQQPPEKLQMIKQKLATRDARLASVIDDLQGLQKSYADVKTQIGAMRAEVSELKDIPVPFGMEKISVFRNGIKEEYAVPKNVGEALKNMNEKNADMITKWASMSSKVLRMGATSLNLGFIPANAIRDFQTATLVSKVGFGPQDWVKGFASAVKRGDDYKAFLKSGGSSGFFELNKNIPKTVRGLMEGNTSKVLKTVTNPVKIMNLIGETVELAPRLGVYKRSIKKGLGATEAAFNARNATVDFSKAGNTMKILNQWVPFINARLQGTTNMFNAIKNKPASSAIKLGVLVGAPVVATYLNNSQKYPELWKTVSETDKRNNFIIIYGDRTDEKGNLLDAIKIPKGDAKIFSNPLENFLDYLNNSDPKSLQQLALEIGSDISPVSFEQGGKFSGGQVLSSVLPPAIKGATESVVNKNLYTGYDIVPQSMKNASPKEQYDDKTSTIAKELGSLLGWSPKKIDNFVSTQFGGAGKQVTQPDKALELITKRFVGAYGGQQDQNLADEAQQAVQSQTDAKLMLKREAQATLDKLSKSDNAAAEFDQIIKDNPDLAKTVIDLKEKQDLGFTNKDYIIQELGVDNGERAKFIKGQFDKLKTDEEKAALWDDLVGKKLISKDVAKQITEMVNSQR